MTIMVEEFNLQPQDYLRITGVSQVGGGSTDLQWFGGDPAPSHWLFATGNTVTVTLVTREDVDVDPNVDARFRARYTAVWEPSPQVLDARQAERVRLVRF